MVISQQYYDVMSVQLLFSNSSHFLATLTNVPSTQEGKVMNSVEILSCHLW